MLRTHTYLVNGHFDHAISPLDRGFAYGDGIFRTMRTRNGVLEYWPIHYQKLVADCAAIGIVCPSAELLMHDYQQLFLIEEAIDDALGVIKIIITRGEGVRGYAPPAITSPTRVMIKSAMPHYVETHYSQGVHLHVCDIRLAHQPALAGIKHLNRLENVMARMEWSSDAIFDGLLLDPQDNVIECTMSNVFARFGQSLITPNLNLCGVAGVTRQRIIGLASQLDLRVEIAQLPMNRLLQSDEVIICNSLYGVFQVTTVNATTWPARRLASQFRKLLSYD